MLSGDEFYPDDVTSGPASDDLEEATYRIVRYHFENGSETLQTGLTLEEAQEHCNDPATQAPLDPVRNIRPWFDGYREE